MRNDTRVLFNAYLQQQAKLNGVPDASQKFSVTPTVEQTLAVRVQESSDFLKLVNVTGVDQQSGQKLGLSASGPAASRTNTTTAERQPRNLAALDEEGYHCHQTNFDTAITYSMLDAWAKFPNFQTLVRNKTIEQIGRDRLMVGWNGKVVSPDTDISENPLLQDVNVGWLEHIRTQAPSRRMHGTKVGADAGHDYRNLDALVFDAINNLLDPWHAEATDLVVILGRELLNEKYLPLVNGTDAPTEVSALNNLMLARTLGGKRAITVPFFPQRSLLITSINNLSIYFQTGTTRRAIIDNPKRDRVEDFVSVNESYVVEELGKVALVDDISLPASDGSWDSNGAPTP